MDCEKNQKINTFFFNYENNYFYLNLYIYTIKYDGRKEGEYRWNEWTRGYSSRKSRNGLQSSGIFPEKELYKFKDKLIDTTVEGIIKKLNLRRPIYSQTSAYGHFGKDGLPWEEIVSIK